MAKNKLFLLDAMALVYRAYFSLAQSPRITSTGKNTNAQFGFTNTIYDLLRKEQPTHMAVVWDTHAPTERHTDFSDYKANRQEAPEDLLNAIPEIKDIVAGFNIANLELDGYEADDVVGTIALQMAADEFDVYMVTPDKDYGQLVRDHVFIYKPGYKGGTFEILGAKEVCEKWDIDHVDKVIDILGLMGDAVDNIPGIPGVGEKTAAKLLKEYGSLENVLANAQHIKGKLGEKVTAGAESAIISKRLATIITNAPINYTVNDLLVGEFNNAALQTIFDGLEFRTLGKRILGDGFQNTAAANQQSDLFGNAVVADIPALPKSGIEQANLDNASTINHQYFVIDEEAGVLEFLQKAMLQQEICIDTETTHLDALQAELVGLSFSWKAHEGYYINTNNGTARKYLALLQPLWERKDVLWIAHNLKYDMLVLKNYNVELQGNYFDTMVAHYDIEPDGKRSMDLLSAKYLNYEPISIETLIGKKGKGQLNMRDVPLESIKEYAAEDADVTYQLKQVLAPMLRTEDVQVLFEKVDNPLVRILANMEFEGVNLDVSFLRNYSTELAKIIEQAQQNVFEQAGVTFNLASPKQLGEVLFDKMKLDDKAKKTKTGQYATGEDVLQKLRKKHQIVDDILVFRELSKLKSTYSDALPQLLNPGTQRIHTSYNQTVVTTGRLSSNNPNLQNIPIKTDNGKEIRKAFIAKDDQHVLMSADYSQIELRIVAAVSGDENMIAAFKANKDIHRATAAKVYGVSEEEVTSDNRRNAKAVNFGIIYGQSAFGLSENLGISRSEAKEIIDNYFEQFSGVKNYMNASIAYAKEHGYVKTIMGRKIKLADINSANATVRSFAERVAINAPIQGSAADMIKLAMIKIDEAMKAAGVSSKMILQVHDELIFDVPKNEIELMKDLIKSNMEQAMVLPNGVPVIAETGMGNNWLDAH